MINKLFKSKTVIVNTMMVVAGVLGYLQGHEVIAEHPEWVAILAAIAGVVNVGLRLITSVPISQKSSLLK